MNKFNILIAVFLLLSCNSKSDKPKIESLKESSENEILSTEKNRNKNSESNIYDTLVFSNNMKGELLDRKIKESQNELLFYKKFINKNKINKIQIVDEKHTTTEIKYLGELNDIANDNLYKVITNFKKIGIDNVTSPKGRSEIAFIDKNDIIMTYNMGMPENLPIYIENDILFFEIKKTKIGILISGGLAPMFCIPKIECGE